MTGQGPNRLKHYLSVVFDNVISENLSQIFRFVKECENKRPKEITVDYMFVFRNRNITF